MTKLAIFCGGLSLERGISLNSARSFIDHTKALDVAVSIIYLNPQGLYYLLSEEQLYSNTPSDFDFKLPLKLRPLSKEALILHLQCMDLIFPLIHGTFGEDGTLQTFLEENHIPFVGSTSEACRSVFDKFQAQKLLQSKGYATLPFLLLPEELPLAEKFLKNESPSKAVVKPTHSGSSLGVKVVNSLEELTDATEDLYRQGFEKLLLQPYCSASEFTVCVVETPSHDPVAFIPLEIEKWDPSLEILDYRSKYLPSTATRYHCPPRFSEATLRDIRSQAEKLFKDARLRDFIRIDGWVSLDGRVLFSDFNPISGMEQNSFLFQQAAHVGLSHTELLKLILDTALKRYGKPPLSYCHHNSKKEKNPVYVLMGGSTAERHVSLMSGTNVFLKLKEEYNVLPFLLDAEENLWQLPYHCMLYHTVEEILEKCHSQDASFFSIVQEIRKKLHLPATSLKTPYKLSFDAFIAKAKVDEAFVFLGLHGGIGEDGTLQKRLEEACLPFNGSNALTSKLCMDKYLSSQKIAALNLPDIQAMPQLSFVITKALEEKKIQALWAEALLLFKLSDFIIKPRCDGCSSGVVRISTLAHFKKYLSLVQQRAKHIPAGTFPYQSSIIEMPQNLNDPFLIEPYIITDKIYIEDTRLCHTTISHWIEVTIGILEKQGMLTALDPSITLAKNHVLSVEEKFQGGTGVNITPPPEEILAAVHLQKVKASALVIAKTLGIQNYARLDLFVHRSTGTVLFIEANTLPALTPSTVLYHQALKLSPPLSPRQLLSTIVESAKQLQKNLN